MGAVPDELTTQERRQLVESMLADRAQQQPAQRQDRPDAAERQAVVEHLLRLHVSTVAAQSNSDSSSAHPSPPLPVHQAASLSPQAAGTLLSPPSSEGSPRGVAGAAAKGTSRAIDQQTRTPRTREPSSRHSPRKMSGRGAGIDGLQYAFAEDVAASAPLHHAGSGESAQQGPIQVSASFLQGESSHADSARGSLAHGSPTSTREASLHFASELCSRPPVRHAQAGATSMRTWPEHTWTMSAEDLQPETFPRWQSHTQICSQAAGNDDAHAHKANQPQHAPQPGNSATQALDDLTATALSSVRPGSAALARRVERARQQHSKAPDTGALIGRIKQKRVHPSVPSAVCTNH